MKTKKLRLKFEESDVYDTFILGENITRNIPGLMRGQKLKLIGYSEEGDRYNLTNVLPPTVKEEFIKVFNSGQDLRIIITTDNRDLIHLLKVDSNYYINVVYSEVIGNNAYNDFKLTEVTTTFKDGIATNRLNTSLILIDKREDGNWYITVNDGTIQEMSITEETLKNIHHHLLILISKKLL